jgi:hypothetical protein
MGNFSMRAGLSPCHRGGMMGKWILNFDGLDSFIND